MSNNMYGTNEISSTPTFDSDDWEVIFGKEDEVDDTKELKSSQNGELDSPAEMVSTNNNSFEIATVYSQRTACSSANSNASPNKQVQGAVSSMVVMELCMKREQKLRVEGNIIEANALSTVGFSIMNLIAKVMELLQLNECIHVGSLILEAVKASMSKGSNEWESLILCAGSIHALIDEVRIKSEGLDDVGQLKMISEAEKKLDKKELATKLAKERRKRKLDAVLTRKQEANEMRKRRHAMQQTEAHSVFTPPITYQAKNYTETSDEASDAILIMAANKYKLRKEERQKQIERKSQANDERKLSQSNVLHTDLQGTNVIPNSPDARSFTGPISAEALMECEESDSSNSITLPSFSVQEAGNQYCLQQPHSFLLSAKEEPTNCHMSSHIRNNFSVTGKTNCPNSTNNIPNQSMTSPYSSTAINISSPAGISQLDINSATTTNPIKIKVMTQSAQKYDNLSFVKIRKVGAKINENTSEKLQPVKKSVLFVGEDKYSIIQVSSNPNSTTDGMNIIGFHDYRKKYPRGSAIMPDEEKRKKVGNLPPREYDFFLKSTISRPIDIVNARSFCESCEFTRGDIRNWFIVGSRFDRLNGNVFGVKKSGCPKTHLSRANYPPIHFRILSDALTRISIDVAGLKIFLAVGEDWVVKRSIMPEEFTSFIRKFAYVLHGLYVKQYTLERTKEVEFTDDLEKIKSDYAYVEMPIIILFTIPIASFPFFLVFRSDSDAEMKCGFYNSAITELVQSWDATWKNFYYHNATKQCIELKLIDWRQLCINENANSNSSMITVLMKHLMEEWGVCMTPKNRS
ncbi:unnamed protein product [Wuchereria bancrofti]|uniref:Uncharacterized protein n=1 Tax=Wuchereria bancrofti TaxID=6293 RepID=A0A3P7DRQ4_WUCBA|nr:unnamed protein product [Wuchereria bancrofti]